MSDFIWFCVTLAVAAAVGLLFYRLKFPAGAMVGALIGVGALQILTGCAVMPASVKILTKTVAGLFVGMSMTAEMVRNMKRLFRPVVTLVCLIFSLCLGAGTLLCRVTELDTVTALFCVAPGGLTDMTLMTMDMGGDAAVVAVLQILRLLSVYCISMPLAKLAGKKWKGRGSGAPLRFLRKRNCLPRRRNGVSCWRPRWRLWVAVRAGASPSYLIFLC